MMITAMATLALALAPMHEPGDLALTWKGEPLTLEELELRLGGPALSAAETWADWARGADYRMDLDREGRVLLVSPSENGGVARQMELIERTVELFDRVLPVPEPPEPPADGKSYKPGKPESASSEPEGMPRSIPEDPESDPYPWQRPRGAATGKTVAQTWGAQASEPDTETIVFVVFRTEPEFHECVEWLAGLFSYLEAWRESALEVTGFTLERPLSGAYVANAAGQEEWNPDNELIHRMSELLLLRRYARQPYWLTQGYSWWAELELSGGVYCFPYRDEFVWATEHTGWKRELKTRMNERGKKALAMDEFADYARGKYDDQKARLSWGVVHHLAAEHPDALPVILEELRLFTAKHGRKTKSDGSWELITDYEVSLKKQRRLLEQHAGKRILHEIPAYFRELE